MKISVLIPFKSDGGGFRDLNFFYVKKRYETLMPDAELVIGEDDGEPFNRARARNMAAAKATGDLFILADADVFFGTRLIDKIKAIADLYPWIIPFCRGYKLSPAATREVTKTGELQLPSNLANIINIAHACVEENCNYPGSLMNVISRRAFETVGGMDEHFIGWGPEDQAFAMALDTLVGKHFRMDETIFHLWHPPAGYRHQYSQANDELQKKYCQAYGDTKSMIRLINEGSKSIP